MQEFANLDTPALWALAVGFFAPLVISVIQQSKWSERTQSLVAFGFYLVVSAVTALVSGAFNASDYLRLALIVFLMASVSYKTLWKPTGVAPAIESATNLPVADAKHVAEAP